MKVAFLSQWKNGNKSVVKALQLREQGMCIKRQNIRLAQIAEDKSMHCNFDTKSVSLTGNVRSSFLVTFNSDWTLMASTHGDHNIHITNIDSGKEIKTLSGHPRTPWTVTFHPTQKDILASGCLGGEVRVWDLDGGSEVWTYNQFIVISSVSFHPSKQLLAIATSNEIFLWDWSQSVPQISMKTDSVAEKVRVVRFDATGRYLYTAITNPMSPGSGETSTARGVSFHFSRPTVYSRSFAPFGSDSSAEVGHPSPLIRKRNTQSSLPGNLRRRLSGLISQVEKLKQEATIQRRTLFNLMSGRNRRSSVTPSESVKQAGSSTSVDQVSREPGTSTSSFRSLFEEIRSRINLCKEIRNKVTTSETSSGISNGYSQLHDAYSALMSGLERLMSQISDVQGDVHLGRSAESNVSTVSGASTSDNRKLNLKLRKLTPVKKSESTNMSVSMSMIDRGKGTRIEDANKPLRLGVQHSSTSIGFEPSEPPSQIDSSNSKQIDDNRSKIKIEAKCTEQEESSSSERSTKSQLVKELMKSLDSLESTLDNYSLENSGTLDNYIAKVEGKYGAESNDTSSERSRTGSSKLVRKRSTCGSFGSGNGSSRSGGGPSGSGVGSSGSGGGPSGFGVGSSGSGGGPSGSTGGESGSADGSPGFGGGLSGSGVKSPGSPMCHSGNRFGAGVGRVTRQMLRSLFDGSASCPSRLDAPTSTSLQSRKRKNASPDKVSSNDASIGRAISRRSASLKQARFTNVDDVAISKSKDVNVCKASKGSSAKVLANKGGNYMAAANGASSTCSLNISSNVGNFVKESFPDIDKDKPSSGEANQFGLKRRKVSALANDRAIRSNCKGSSSNERAQKRGGKASSSNGRPGKRGGKASSSNGRPRKRGGKEGPPNERARGRVVKSTLSDLGMDGKNSTIHKLLRRPVVVIQPDIGGRKRKVSQPLKSETPSAASQTPAETPQRDWVFFSNGFVDRTILGGSNPSPIQTTSNGNESTFQPIGSNGPRVASTSTPVGGISEEGGDPVQTPIYSHAGPSQASTTSQTSDSVAGRGWTVHLQMQDDQPPRIGRSLVARYRMRTRHRSSSPPRPPPATTPAPPPVSSEPPAPPPAPSQVRTRIRLRMEDDESPESPPDLTVTVRVLHDPGSDAASPEPTPAPVPPLFPRRSRLLRPPMWISTERRPPPRGAPPPAGAGSPPSPPSGLAPSGVWLDPPLIPSSRVSFGRPHATPEETTSLQTAINRAIAGAFANVLENASGNGSGGLHNQTCRIQCWDIDSMPSISDPDANVLVPHCKILNDSSIDISSDGRLLATFIPFYGSYPSYHSPSAVGIFSLESATKGRLLHTKPVGPAAVSLSISPRSRYILLGLGSNRLNWHFGSSRQAIAEILQLVSQPGSSEAALLQHVASVNHDNATVSRRSTFVSVNAAKWLPQTAVGFVYGTSRGDLHMCRAATPKVVPVPSVFLTDIFSSRGGRDSSLSQSASTQTDLL